MSKLNNPYRIAASIRKAARMVPANDPPRVPDVDPLDGVCDEPAAYDWRREPAREVAA